jgi:hypothetical protein
MTVGAALVDAQQPTKASVLEAQPSPRVCQILAAIGREFRCHGTIPGRLP